HGMACPRPGLAVLGDAEHLRAVLSGTRRGGVPTDDLLALMAVRDSPLVIAQALPPAVAPQRQLAALELGPIPDAWFDAEDPPVGMRLRLEYDPARDNAVLELLLRFEKG